MSQAASQDSLPSFSPPSPQIWEAWGWSPPPFPRTTQSRGWARGGAILAAEMLMLRFTSEYYLLVPRRSNASDIYKKLEFPASSVVQFQMPFWFATALFNLQPAGPVR